MYTLTVNHHNNLNAGETTTITHHNLSELIPAIEEMTGRYFTEWFADESPWRNVAPLIDHLLSAADDEDLEDYPEAFDESATIDAFQAWMIEVAPYETITAFAARAFDEHPNHVHVTVQ